MNKEKTLVLGVAGIILLGLVVFVVRGSLYSEIEVVVTNTERVCSSVKNSECKYMTFTDVETFENTDSVMFLKFNSSDLHGKLSKGGKFKVGVWGVRISLLSMHRNIVEILD